MILTADDWAATLLTLKLAFTVTVILLIIGTPVAWWLSRTHSRWKSLVAVIVAMPLVLPPTVLGFYLLLLLGPNGPGGKLTQALGLGLLPFTFSGLVVASVLYSMPFVIQPLQNAFESVHESLLEAAATLRASPLDTFRHVVMPLARPGFVTASILGFAHTIGEFGVVLMIGGNIPGATRVMSVQIYNHVEAMRYENAHALAAGMMILSLLVLWIIYSRRRPEVLRG